MSAVCSAIAGPKRHAATTGAGNHPDAVIQRRSAHQLMRIDTLAVDAGPALPDRRKRTTEKLFDEVDEIGVRRLGYVERERLFVFVGVADRQPAVESLHAQQLHAVLTLATDSWDSLRCSSCKAGPA